MIKITSLKALYRLSVVSVMLTLVVMGSISIFSVNKTVRLTDEIVNDAINETHHVMKLQMALHEVTMPVNDHIIHANPAEQDNYQALKKKVRALREEGLVKPEMFVDKPVEPDAFIVKVQQLIGS